MGAAKEKLRVIDDRVTGLRESLRSDNDRETKRHGDLETKLSDARAVVAYLSAALERAQREERAIQADYIHAHTSHRLRREMIEAIAGLEDGEPVPPPF